MRDHNRCRRCGTDATGMPLHHRKPRGSGGTTDPAINSPANLILACLHCHNWIETHRTYGYENGWLVHREHNPADIPVIDNLGHIFWITDDGRIQFRSGNAA
jgi:5-methylcytosine-specific restriction protein A